MPIELSLGDTTRCTLPSPNTSPIAGLTVACKNTSSVPYSVLPTTGSTYSWLIDGGIQSSGGTSNVITVNWGSTGKAGSVHRCLSLSTDLRVDECRDFHHRRTFNTDNDITRQ